MAERIWDYLRAFSVLLSDIALGCLVVSLVPLVMHWDMSIAVLYWVAAAAVQLLIGSWIITIGASWSVYLALEGAATAAGCFFVVGGSFCTAHEADMLLLLAFAVLTVGAHNALAAYRLPSANTILRYVDVIIAVLAFYLYGAFEAGRPEDQGCLLLALAALGLDLLTVSHLRTDGESPNIIRGAGAGSRLVLMVIFAVCLLATGAVVGLASGQVHSAVDVLLLILQGIWKVAEVIFGAVGKVLGFLILFLIALFPLAPEMARENAAFQLEEQAAEIIEETGLQVPAWVSAAVMIVLLLAAVIWILYHFRHVHIQQIRPSRRRRRAVRKSYFLETLAKLVRRICERCCFEWQYLRFRKTPQGLLVLAERTGRKRKLDRRANESPGAYIRRLDEAVRTDEENTTLSELAECMDFIFYGGRDCPPKEFDYPKYARAIRSLQ